MSRDAWLWPVLVVADARAMPAALLGLAADDASVRIGRPFQATTPSSRGVGALTRAPLRKGVLASFELDPERGSLSSDQVQMGLAVVLTVGDPRSAATATALARFKTDLQATISRELAAEFGLPNLDELLAGRAPELDAPDLSALVTGRVKPRARRSGPLARLTVGAVHTTLRKEARTEGAGLTTELAVLSRLIEDPAAAAALTRKLDVPRRGEPLRARPLLATHAPLVAQPVASLAAHAHLDLAALLEANETEEVVLASFLQLWTLEEVEARGTLRFRRVLQAPGTRRLSFQVEGQVRLSDVVEGAVTPGKGGLSHLARLPDGSVRLLSAGASLDLSRVVPGRKAEGTPVLQTDARGLSVAVWTTKGGDLVGVVEESAGRWRDLSLPQTLRSKAAGALSLHIAGSTPVLAWREPDGGLGLGAGERGIRWRPLEGPKVTLSGDPVLTSLGGGKSLLLAAVDARSSLRAFARDPRGRWEDLKPPDIDGAVGRPAWAGEELLWLCVRRKDGALLLLGRKGSRWSRPLNLTERTGAPPASADPCLVLWRGEPVVGMLADDGGVYILADRSPLGWSRRALSRSLGEKEASGEPALSVQGDRLSVAWSTGSGRLVSASRTGTSDWTSTAGDLR